MSIVATIISSAQTVGRIAQKLAQLAPIKRAIDYKLNELAPNMVNDPSVQIVLYNKGLIEPAQFLERMRLFGFDNATALEQVKAAERMLDMAEYVALERRGKISPSDLLKYAEKLNFNLDELSNVKDITEYYPNPADLVRFAVREVYTPRIVQEYQMLEDLPEQFLDAAAKAGMPAEQARDFWAAHWELPSLTMGFSMLHRGIITDEQLKTLMKSLDVMPYWRDKLIQLSYNPLTRVDVRRMYGFGVLDPDELEKAYKNIGYNDYNAQKMAEFTVAYEDNEYKGITRSNIISAYEDGLIDDNHLLLYLTGLGYSKTVIDFWYNNAVYQKTQKQIKDRTVELKTAFLEGVLTLEEIRITLLNEGVSDQYLLTVLNDFERSKVQKLKNVPQDILGRWYSSGVIDEFTYNNRMLRLGYDMETIALYMTELSDPEKPIKRKFLKVETYVEWYKQKIIDRQYLEYTLRSMGMIPRDINVLIEQAEKPEEEE